MSKIVPLDNPPAETENLPYCIELWDSGRNGVERILARAFSAPLARAIFKAATGEHPDRRITVRRGNRTISDSAS
ncbi:MAG: hypothetical protein JO128_08525 [Alphaproteobacteria bacterium]|nr:hypothetical protein [Alphaproteobacteria bacterium]